MKSGQKILPDWLEKLQGNSWQIELLIAGGIVITLYQIPDYFKRMFILSYETTYLNDYILISLFLAYLLTRILLIGFIVNLALRALWVALIGIYSSFPKGINPEGEQVYHLLSEKEKKSLNIKRRLDNIDAACNLSYSIAILLAMISVSTTILLVIFDEIIDAIPVYTFLDRAIGKYFLAVFSFFIVTGAFERLTFRVFKKRHRIIQGIFSFFSYISLSFLYKKEWLTLITNIKPWKILSIFFVYFIIGLLVSINQIGSYLKLEGFFNYNILDDRDYLDIPLAYDLKFNNYYESIPEEKSFAFQACISREVLKDKYEWIFINYWKEMDESLEYHLEKYAVSLTDDDFEEFEDRLRSDSLYKEALNEIFIIEIDGKRIEPLVWYEHQLTKTGEYGFKTYFATDSLTSGHHNMIIKMKDFNWKRELTEFQWVRIPFIKE
ncbi:MAG: hypothetical protein AAFO07_26315 [Bacteroidota bacterium]